MNFNGSCVKISILLDLLSKEWVFHSGNTPLQIALTSLSSGILLLSLSSLLGRDEKNSSLVP